MSIDYNFLNEPLTENPASSKSPDVFQIKAITKKDNAVVSAGAGSGKTDVLALRYAFLLMTDENIRIKNILALTFTKEAASEIYDRIYKKLNAFVKFLDNDKYPKQVKLAKRALDEFADAKIQTLDAYSGSLVRIAASRYGIRPDFTTGSSSCDRAIEDAALPFVLKHRTEECFNVYSIPGKIEDFAANYFAAPVLKCTSVATRKNFFSDNFQIQKAQIIEEWNSFFDENENSIKSQFEDLKLLLNESDKKNTFVSELKELVDKNDFTESRTFFSFYSLDEKNANSFSATAQDFCSSINSICSINMNKGGSKGSVKEIKEIIKKIREIIPIVVSVVNFIKNFSAQKRMFELLDEFLEEVNNTKRISGNLSFKDVGDLALRILIEQPDIRKQQKNLIKKIMIDEFQDNNKKNKELLFLISENDCKELLVENKTEAEFFIELEKNISTEKLFFVGDEKQSIYKFRGADVSVFNELKKSLKDNSGCEENVNLNMTNNYRSSVPLLYSFNLMFGNCNNNQPLNETEIPSLFYSEENGIANVKSYEAEYKHNALKKNELPASVSANNVPVHLCLLNTGENEDGSSFTDFVNYGKCLSKEETEAYFIARKIYELSKNDSNFNNYAILDNSRSGRFYLQRYLSIFNIPYTVDRQTNVFSEGIVNDFYCFLRFCVYPSDSNAFAAFLSSPFAGISMQGVQNILSSSVKKTKNSEILFSAFEENDSLSLSDSDMKKYLAAKSFYEELRDDILSQSLTKSLELLWYKTGYYFETILNRNLSLYSEQFDLLYETARQAENEGKSISWFVDQLGIAKKKEISSYMNDESVELELKEISYPIEKPDAVKIMTIHQSKGLQFKHVFVIGIWGNPKAQTTGTFFFDEDGFDGKNATGVSLCALGEGGNYFSVRQKEDSALRELAEQKRKIYVAITRAEEDVHLVGSLSRSKELKKFDDSDNAEKKYDGPLSLMHKLCRFYYQKELYDDNDFSFESYCNEPVFNKNGAPFDFIKINPVSTKVRADDKINLDELRQEKIKLFSAFYDKIPFEKDINFPLEFFDKTQTPSGLEKLPPKTSVKINSEFKINEEYSSVDLILKPDVGDSEDNEEDSASSKFNYADFGKLAHSYLESFVSTGNILNAENFVDRIVAKKLSENQKAKEILLKTVVSMCEAFEKSELGKKVADAKNSNRLCKAENKFKFLMDDTIFTGSMDLIFQDLDQKLFIVDYKTDRIAKPELYIEQLSCYRKAASEIFHVDAKDIKTFLYYLRYDKEIDISAYTI
ncbi:UvrD-helicase domain-containing protein [uncultured Treponema sp.]|uniref:UvrD-helicase domain-containing protein n=1 Tax=uncultured Treponema sp. TaxID=162155 RepID=UPI0025F36D8B|nr:UvrD-helicase domain-containing protein [uncultured Treponema sp.]